jgi:membrane carboxypeptidase/penicillin-binding protein PbpC
MRKRLVLTVLALVAALLSFGVWIAASAYLRAPKLVAAWAFDRSVSKETQLRVFLNRTYFGSAGGREVIGFPAAANDFYGKPLARLSDSEYFGLLAMLDAPNSYHVVLQPKVNAERAAKIQQQVQRACGAGCFQGDAPVPCATTIGTR